MGTLEPSNDISTITEVFPAGVPTLHWSCAMSTSSDNHSQNPRSTNLNPWDEPSFDPQLNNPEPEESEQHFQDERSLHRAQETLYRFFLDIVKDWSPEEVLVEFKRLFFYQFDPVNSQAMHAVYEIIFSNNEIEFKNTLKRCCYILVNNWDARRHYQSVYELIQIFQEPTLEKYTVSPTLKRLRDWIVNFKNSQDYEELKLFTTRYEDRKQKKENWVSRYTSYLLVPQYVDLSNPIEQREAARALSRQLKDRFKFDLAIYIARSQSATSPEKVPENPTALGDSALHLVKTIVARRGYFSYANLANIFVNQTQNSRYQEFKLSLQKYLVFSVEKSELSITLQVRLSEKLELLYTDYDNHLTSDSLLLRTCNRVIDYLTTENKEEPSPLFVMLASQGNPMTLVIVLLKLILICKAARSHLEARIAELIRYYEKYPEHDCKWIVNFLEIFNVAFTIHTENVQYNLVDMQDSRNHSPHLQANLDAYRIFSQTRLAPEA
jgi:hypothetical protein